MDDVKISKTLCWFLRHRGVEEGITFDDDGYFDVETILKHEHFRNKCNVDDIQRIVKNSDKQRFKLRFHPESGTLQIRANHGHSISIGSNDLEPLTDVNATVVHGTFIKAWDGIKKNGLSRMKRIHIHFDSNGGNRKNAEIHVYIDLKKAIPDGIKFYKSTNGVILSPGNDKGIIDTKYFSKAILVSNNRPVPY